MSKSVLIPLILAILSIGLLSGCKSRDGQEQTAGEAFQEYLREHSSPGWKGSGWFVQYGRVEFYGSFPVEILAVNKAFPATSRDATEIRESMMPVFAQATALPNGQVVYPSIQQRMRVVRIAHMVKSTNGEVPVPSWEGAIIHERTEISTDGNGYAIESDTPPVYHKEYKKREQDTAPYNRDGPSYWKSDGSYQYGRMPYKGEEGPSPYWQDNQPKQDGEKKP